MSQSSGGLLAPQSMGGLLARKGFRFQDLWLAGQVCAWMVNPQFRGFVNEGVDDVDVFWHGDHNYPERRERYQLKDELVGGPTLADFLNRSKAAHDATNGEWYCYWLIASRCIQSFDSLPTKLERTQRAQIPYGVTSATYRATVAELRDALANIDKCPDVDFVIERIRLDFSVGNLADSDRYWGDLSWKLVAQLHVEASRVFDATNALLMTLMARRVGVFLQREDILSIVAPYRTPAAQQQAKDERLLAPPAEVKPPFATSPADAFCKVSIFPGNAQLIRLPNAVVGLIDCGKYSVRWIIEALAEHRIRALNFLAVTHWDRDHFDGMQTVLDILDRVGTFWMPYTPALLHQDERPSEMLERLRSMIGSKIGAVKELGESTALASVPTPEGAIAALVEAMNPASRALPPETQVGHLIPNDLCAVYRASVGSTNCLLTGDASIRAWETLIAARDRTSSPLAADLLMVPHHGSRGSLNQSIAARLLKPGRSLAVLEPLARHRLPHSEVLDLLDAMNTEVVSFEDRPLHFVLFQDGLYVRRT
ncbi:hypothetical protein AYO44_12370 [Planctomycetaceae bacterium SCGC AG-212-F19]|nr:hypothetical protein AYO44_12370 [Planctomycetaceae bacterium SCGC AG-212-F19]